MYNSVYAAISIAIIITIIVAATTITITISTVTVVLASCCAIVSQCEAAGPAEMVREMFRHAFNGYMMHAFPLDELDPISCRGRGLTGLKSNAASYHIRGGFMLTLVDSLSGLAIVGTREEFYRAVDLFKAEFKGFGIDNEVLTFEANIRVLGGLLSAYQLLTDQRSPLARSCPDDEALLRLCTDLGRRLLSAFSSPTGLPFSLVNLKTGRPGVFNTTCSAAAGTYLLEFGLLSDLTGIGVFKTAALRATSFILGRRSEVGLVGNEVNVRTGSWADDHAALGAGIDSFYEYLLKYAIYGGDCTIYDAWRASFSSISKHLVDRNGFLRVVNRESGEPYSLSRVDSLSAFAPGLFTLHGDLELAERVWDTFYAIHLKYTKIPEAFNVDARTGFDAPHLLRPEFLESTYYLYRATRNPLYRAVALDAANELQRCCRTSCGFAALARSGDSSSRISHMDSFFLAETLMYLYLIFDEDHWAHKAPILFTTEAHPIFINASAPSRASMAPCTRPASPQPFATDGDKAARRLEVGRTVNRKINTSTYLDNWSDFHDQNTCYSSGDDRNKVEAVISLDARADPHWRFLRAPKYFKDSALLSFRKRSKGDRSVLQLHSVDGCVKREAVTLLHCSSSHGKLHELVDISGEHVMFVWLPRRLSQSLSIVRSEEFRACGDPACLAKLSRSVNFGLVATLTTVKDHPGAGIAPVIVIRAGDMRDSLHITQVHDRWRRLERLPSSGAFLGSIRVENLNIVKLDCSEWTLPFSDESRIGG